MIKLFSTFNFDIPKILKTIKKIETINTKFVFSIESLESGLVKKDKIDKINKVHNYLENTEHVGKVLSFSSIIQVATKLNNNKELGTLEMGVLYSKIPETVKSEIIDPYISIKDDEARISLRIKDSSSELRRNELIN